MRNYISKKEAKLALIRGHKISHSSFLDFEFVQLDSNKNLIDETAIVLNYADFWINRASDFWNDGWFIVE